MCSTYIYENRCLPNIRGKYQAVNLITIAYHVIMANHYGQIVEKVIRRDGHSISDVSRLMKVNRRSVYNWFNQPNLRPEIIYRIGRIIKHDFSVDLPHVFKSEDFAFENKSIIIQNLSRRSQLLKTVITGKKSTPNCSRAISCWQRTRWT